MKNNFFPYRHIIWDWNGTLLNDKWLCIESINSLLAQRNLPVISDEIYHKIFGFPVRSYYQRAGFDFDIEPFEVPALQFIKLYDRKKFQCSLQPGGHDLLQHLNKIGCRQYLLSASETGMLIEMTQHHGIEHFFLKIKGLDNHYAHGKSDLGLELLKEIDPEPGTVLMIGDTCHDEEVARMMGIQCILFSGGHFPSWRLQACTSRIIDHLSDLLSMD